MRTTCVLHYVGGFSEGVESLNVTVRYKLVIKVISSEVAQKYGGTNWQQVIYDNEEDKTIATNRIH